MNRLTENEKIEKNLNYNFIKGFAQISLSNICKKHHLSKQNLSNNRISAKKMKIVKNEIEKQFSELYVKYCKDMIEEMKNEKTDSL